MNNPDDTQSVAILSQEWVTCQLLDKGQFLL